MCHDFDSKSLFLNLIVLRINICWSFSLNLGFLTRVHSSNKIMKNKSSVKIVELFDKLISRHDWAWVVFHNTISQHNNLHSFCPTDSSHLYRLVVNWVSILSKTFVGMRCLIHFMRISQPLHLNFYETGSYFNINWKTRTHEHLRVEWF